MWSKYAYPKCILICIYPLSFYSKYMLQKVETLNCNLLCTFYHSVLIKYGKRLEC